MQWPRKFLLMIFIVAGASLAAVSSIRAAAAPDDALNYTRDQALSGRASYDGKCSACHGADLEGRAAPALRGPAFQQQWMRGNHKAAELFLKIQQSMPAQAPASLSDEEYVGLVAYILSQNGYRPTASSLAGSDLLKFMPPNADNEPVALDPPLLPLASFPQAPIQSETASSDHPNDADLAHADPNQWLMYNGTYTGQRFSDIDQINTATASKLAPVCIFQPGEIGSFQTAPIVYGKLMYVTTPYNTFAVDDVTCRKVWEYRYPADASAKWSVNRGVAIYKGKLFRGTPDGHLIALDAESGKLLWDVWMVDKRHGYWLSGAPIAHAGLVYMGAAGADWGANGAIEAFDADTGQVRWRFNVIPTGNEIGADTWGKGSDKGGGSFWSTFSLDEAKNQILFSVGNPAPDFRSDLRPGDNLFTDSVVALDAATGKLAWWVQQVPHDTHDWDTAAAPVIYDQDGHSYVSVANKGGWLYIYDRKTRELIAKSEISPHLNADTSLTAAGVHHCPGTLGGAEWNGAAYSPPTRALYVNSVHWCSTTGVSPDRYVEGSGYFDGVPLADPASQAKGFTRAFDAATGKELWSRQFDAPMLAAITPTAGGVLFTGTLDGDFLVLDARDGSTLYRFNTGGAVAGAPTTYMAGGKQYVAIASGNNSRMVWQTGGAMMVAIFALQE